MGGLSESFRACVGFLLDGAGPPAEAGEEWRPLLGQWLARRGLGLVPVAAPERFSWPGYWLGVVAAGGGEVAVVLFGTPPAVVESPGAPQLLGATPDTLHWREGLVLAPFRPAGAPPPDMERQAGELVAIYVAARRTEPMTALESVEARPGLGLLGDRYAARAGTFTPRSDRLRGYEVTLIESEALENGALPGGDRLAFGESRRNLVTRGVDLNALVGREFSVGVVRLYGQRLCEPCAHLERLTRPGVIRTLAHRAGLRADVLSAGTISVGDPLVGGAGPVSRPGLPDPAGSAPAAG